MTQKHEPLCKHCMNREIGFILHGRHYSQELVCEYGMSAFPVARECYKYVPMGTPREEDLD